MPWADVVYGCDGPWWENGGGLPEYRGTKLCHDTGVCATYRDIHKVEVEDHDLMLFGERGRVGSGGNSGFQGINLAIQFGSRRVLLVGFDMHGAQGLHWYGANHGRNRRNPSDNNFAHWRAALNAQAHVLARRGIDVINTSMESALTAFRQCPLDQALEEWGL